jgi:hypothetical protein
MGKLTFCAYFSIAVFVTAFFVLVSTNVVHAATCTIVGNVTQSQSDLETCAGGTLDNLVVNTGVTLTLSEAITVVSDVTINGTGKITHLAEDTDGVNITAGGDMLITGSIDVDGRGCGG